ncbi:MAG: hypothetical protein IKT52_02430, partial [Oscillospiraceae bacterium]|nr:hypothetical protein [Oscillospiraceae bacterium]
QRQDDRYPVAVLGIFVGGGAPSSSADRSHSLALLDLPLAARGSLPLTVKIGNANMKASTERSGLFCLCRI